MVRSAELGPQDTTDRSIFGPLSPGVRLSSASATLSSTYSSLGRSTIAGVLLQNNFGHRQMAAALHGFPEPDEVFHPDRTGVRIGEIDERWTGLDIALTRLDPSILFFNEEYFGVNPPMRLLYSSQALRGDWYEADGISTGVVFFELRGERILCSPRLDIEKRASSIIYAHAPSGGT